ncbi:MAG: UDP-3-O-(3-hydroxymyristoyl)glucosamine N-acyltransferase [Phycisphaerae bacterium]
MTTTLRELADRLGGRLDGDPGRQVRAVAALADAGPADVAFVSLPRYAKEAAASSAGCLVVPEDWQPPAETGEGAGPGALLYVADVNRAMVRAAEMLCPPLPVPAAGVHPKAAVADSAALGEGVHVGACAVVGEHARVGDRTRIRAGAVVADEAVLGADCDVHSGVVIRERCRLGDRVVVHAGSVIGSDGFGYTAGEAGPEKIPQLGTVEIGDDAEIGAGVTVDRARFGATRIGRKVKIDNLVQIAHNVEVGEGTVIVAQVAVAGSTRIGRGCRIAGQAAIDGHLTIGDGARVAAKAGVTKDVPPGTDVSGYPAVEHRQHLREQAALRRSAEVLAWLKRIKPRRETPPDGEEA